MAMDSFEKEPTKTTTSDLLGQELKKQLKEIFELQEERVHVSNKFETSFREYLLDAPNFDLKKLQNVCKTISEEMNVISSKIISIKNRFSSQVYNIKHLYELVDQLQTYEETKFKLTLEYYVCEQEKFEKLAATDEYEYFYKEKLDSIRKKLNDVKLKINDCLEDLRYELYDSK